MPCFSFTNYIGEHLRNEHGLSQQQKFKIDPFIIGEKLLHDKNR